MMASWLSGKDFELASGMTQKLEDARDNWGMRHAGRQPRRRPDWLC
jgi:hypothetical protein